MTRLLFLLLIFPAFLLCGLTHAADEPASSKENSAASQPTTAPASLDLQNTDGIKAAMGKVVKVEGVVRDSQWSKSGKILRIQFEGAEQTRFLAVIFSSEKEQFNRAYKGDVAKTLMGAIIRVQGKLVLYKELPEIVIKDESQLEIVRPASESKDEAKQQ